MQTLSVTLSHEATSMEDLAAQYPGASLHVIHLAVLRVGIGAALQDRKVVEAELARIQDERRVRRQNARTERGGVR
jgi:hypothetical protein